MRSVEKILGFSQTKPWVSLTIIVIACFLMRMYFTPWNSFPPSSDTLVYMIEGIQYSEGEFDQFNSRFLWSAFLGGFFVFFKFEDNLGYITIMRVLSILISVACVPVFYYIASHFFEKRWAVFASVIFAFEPNIIQNSTWAIREPIFLFLGLVSFYFIVQKNEKLIPLSFLFAGLAFDARVNGIAIFITILVACFFRFNQSRTIFKNLIFGVGIFLIISFPHFIESDDGKINFLNYLPSFIDSLSSEKSTTATFTAEKSSSPFDKLTTAIEREILHLGRIQLPFLIFLAPVGFLLILKNLNYEKKVLLISIISSLIIAVPIYTISAEFRSLFFITPMLCIFSGFAVEKFWQKSKFKNTFLLVIVTIMFFSSMIFLNELAQDEELVREKQNFSKYIVNTYSGTFMGDLYAQISFNIPNAKVGQAEEDPNISNDRFRLVVSEYPIDSKSKLLEYVKQRKIDYLIIDDENDRRYPIFQEIYHNENNFPFLEKIFDSNDFEYKKLRVKVFSVNEL